MLVFDQGSEIRNTLNSFKETVGVFDLKPAF